MYVADCTLVQANVVSAAVHAYVVQKSILYQLEFFG